MKSSASKRRLGASVAASLALAAGGVAWAGCGDEEDDAADTAQEIQDQVNQELDDADVPEDVQEAIDKAQDEANEASDDINEALEDGDVQEAIDKAQEQAEEQSEEAQEQLDEALEDIDY